MNSVAKRTVIFFVIAMAVFACGNKKDPEPPGNREIPVVEDLRAEQRNGQVILKWGLSHAQADALEDLEGFYVLRAGSSLSSPECKACPLEYASIGDVAVGPEKTIPRSWSFVDSPPAGFIYSYKIRTYSRFDKAGPPSRAVSVGLPGAGGNMGDN